MFQVLLFSEFIADNQTLHCHVEKFMPMIGCLRYFNFINSYVYRLHLWNMLPHKFVSQASANSFIYVAFKCSHFLNL